MGVAPVTGPDPWSNEEGDAWEVIGPGISPLSANAGESRTPARLRPTGQSYKLQAASSKLQATSLTESYI